MAIADEIKYGEIIFNSRLKQARILALNDPAAAARDIEAMAQEFPDDDGQAVIYYTLYKITGDPGFKDRAIELYRKLLGMQFEIDNQRRLDELIGKSGEGVAQT
jgi:hypothetical protein